MWLSQATDYRGESEPVEELGDIINMGDDPTIELPTTELLLNTHKEYAKAIKNW